MLGRGVCEVRNSSYSSQAGGGGWEPAGTRPRPRPPTGPASAIRVAAEARKPAPQVDRGDSAPLVPDPPQPFPAPSAPPCQGHPPAPGVAVSEWGRDSRGQQVKLALAAGTSGQEMTSWYPPLPGRGGTGLVENLGDECRSRVLVSVVVLSCSPTSHLQGASWGIPEP